MNIEFLLYLGFTAVLNIITITDLFCGTVDDRVIIAGTIYALICQFYLGQITFSVIGAFVGFTISFAVFIFGNSYFSVPIKKDEVCCESLNAGLVFPFVPSLAFSVLVHALLPEGLVTFLFNLIIFIQSSFVIFSAVIIIAIILLIVIIHSKKNCSVPTHFDSKDKGISAFGDGDVTTSVFLGSVLGWETLIAIFWLATVIHSIVGVIILFKKKGIFKWI